LPQIYDKNYGASTESKPVRFGRVAMNTGSEVLPQAGAIIRSYEEAADAANMRALDLAISFFDAGACEVPPMGELEMLRTMAEKGLHTSGEIDRLMRGLRACRPATDAFV
jgi:hypothetical protein